MGRYRPPPKPVSPYITPDGYERLQRELNTLWRVERPKVTQQVAEAAALGDRSENAEYIYGKKRLREIDARLHFLHKRINEVTVVNLNPENKHTVYFGAWIKLKNSQNVVLCVRIVGADEIDLSNQWISVDSPLAKAALGKSVGEQFKISLPTGQDHYYILEISYDDNPCVT